MYTAFITGATGGIGLEMARIFAKKGYGLVLVARNEKRLIEIREELVVSAAGIRIFARDLSEPNQAEDVYGRLKEEQIRIDFVVNNAGFGIDAPYTETPWEEESRMLRLNILAVAYFTRVFADDMKRHGFGRILNVASIAAFQPGPYMAAYCASKAFVLSLSEAVGYELKGSGVSVAALCPGVTDTGFHAVARTEQVGMSRYLPHASAREVARYGYRLLTKKKAVGVYGWLNRLLVFSNRLVPRKMSTALAAKLLKG